MSVFHVMSGDKNKPFKVKSVAWFFLRKMSAEVVGLGWEIGKDVVKSLSRRIWP